MGAAAFVCENNCFVTLARRCEADRAIVYLDFLIGCKSSVDLLLGVLLVLYLFGIAAAPNAAGFDLFMVVLLLCIETNASLFSFNGASIVDALEMMFCCDFYCFDKKVLEAGAVPVALDYTPIKFIIYKFYCDPETMRCRVICFCSLAFILLEACFTRFKPLGEIVSFDYSLAS